MARIAFFSERLPNQKSAQDSVIASSNDPIAAFSFDLMLSLADQQHEVRVFSTYREDEIPPRTHPRLQILRPFKKWGWLEIPRLIPILLEFQPEILHFIQPRAESLEGLTNAMSALPGLAAILSKPRIIVSLYDVRKEELAKHRSLLVTADAITVTNRPQADVVGKWLGEIGRTPLISIVPLPSRDIRANLDAEIKIPEEGLEEPSILHAFGSSSEKVILVPGEIGDHRDPEALVSLLVETLNRVPESKVIFAGGWGRLPVIRRRSLMKKFEERGHGARVLLTGPLNEENERLAITVANVVFLPSLPGESLSLVRWTREALSTSTPAILSQSQRDLDPLPWRDRENAFIVEDDGINWGATLTDSLLSEDVSREIRERLPEFARSEAFDQPGNAMSRIYAQILERQKR